MVSVYFTCEGRLVIIRSFARCVFFLLLLPATSPDAPPHHSYPCLSYAGWVHTEHCRIPSPTLPSCWIRADPIDKKHAWLSQLDGQPRPGMVRGRSHCKYFAAHISHAPSHVNRSAAQRVTPPQQKKAKKRPTAGRRRRSSDRDPRHRKSKRSHTNPISAPGMSRLGNLAWRRTSR